MRFSKSDYYLAFQCCKGIGPKTFEVIVEGFGSPKRAWNAGVGTWKHLGFGKRLVELFKQHHDEFDLGKMRNLLRAHQIRYVPKYDLEYPSRLKEVVGHPIGLFIKGKILPKDDCCLAVVGSRKMTDYGAEATQIMVSGLVNRGVTIVSGLARGIDGMAHRVALDSGGRTIAVVGSGLDVIYPREHRQLFFDISKQGAVVSEYPPGMRAVAGNFPARNRIVSGMSLGVLVIEGAHKSGSLITAMMAVDQNREVFAVPGSIRSQMSEAPLELIKMGAKLVTDVDDIVDELNLPEAMLRDQVDDFENDLERKVYECLQTGNCHIDGIVRSVGECSSDVSATLSMLEIQGIVVSLGNGKWMVKL